MSSASTLVIDFAAIALIVWLFQQVRRNRFYVGYAVVFVLLLVAGMVGLSVPRILNLINRLGEPLAKAPGLVVLVLAFLVAMLAYLLGQLTQLSHRVTTLVQELAIRDARAGRSAGEPTPEDRHEP